MTTNPRPAPKRVALWKILALMLGVLAAVALLSNSLPLIYFAVVGGL
ncbi:hypothetical protein [Isoptericola sp. NPDC019482]